MPLVEVSKTNFKPIANSPLDRKEKHGPSFVCFTLRACRFHARTSPQAEAPLDLGCDFAAVWAVVLLGASPALRQPDRWWASRVHWNRTSDRDDRQTGEHRRLPERHWNRDAG